MLSVTREQWTEYNRLQSQEHLMKVSENVLAELREVMGTPDFENIIDWAKALTAKARQDVTGMIDMVLKVRAAISCPYGTDLLAFSREIAERLEKAESSVEKYSEIMKSIRFESGCPDGDYIVSHLHKMREAILSHRAGTFAYTSSLN